MAEEFRVGRIVTLAVLCIAVVGPIALLVLHALPRYPSPASVLATDPSRMSLLDLMLTAALRTVGVSAMASAISLPSSLIAAFGLARLGPVALTVVVLVLALPMFLNVLVVILAWLVILQPDGAFVWLTTVGFAQSLLDALRHSTLASVIAIVNVLIPVQTLLFIYSIKQRDDSLVDASLLLGVSRARTFWSIDLGLLAPSIAGVWAIGTLITVNLYLIPEFITGPKLTMLPFLIQQAVIQKFDLAQAARLAMVTMVVTLVPILLARLVQLRLGGRG